MASAPPADGQYLGWNISANQWEPKTLPAVLVASVFGRTGPVVSQNGDYSFAQISGSVGAAQLPAAAMRTDQGNTVTAGTQDFSGAAHTLAHEIRPHRESSKPLRHRGTVLRHRRAAGPKHLRLHGHKYLVDPGKPYG